MKILLVFVCVCVTLGYAAVFREKPNEKADPGHCLSSSYPELGQMKYGEKKDVPNKCLQLNCGNDGGIAGHTCGSVGVGPGQVLSDYDYSKPYPDCCPKLQAKP